MGDVVPQRRGAVVGEVLLLRVAVRQGFSSSPVSILPWLGTPGNRAPAHGVHLKDSRNTGDQGRGRNMAGCSTSTFRPIADKQYAQTGELLDGVTLLTLISRDSLIVEAQNKRSSSVLEKLPCYSVTLQKCHNQPANHTNMCHFHYRGVLTDDKRQHFEIIHGQTTQRIVVTFALLLVSTLKAGRVSLPTEIGEAAWDAGGLVSKNPVVRKGDWRLPTFPSGCLGSLLRAQLKHSARPRDPSSRTLLLTQCRAHHH